MEKKYDVTALGELLIDFAVNGESEQGNQLFEACPGGAPCNVLAMLNKLGRKTAFIGKVGDDQFGKLLKDTITNTGIEAKGLVMIRIFTQHLLLYILSRMVTENFLFTANREQI